MQKKMKATLLLVDDDPLQLEILTRGLRGEHKLITASNGREALEKLEKSQVDLILSDIVMPEIDGVHLYQKLQKNPRTQAIPIIFLTSLSSVEQKIELLKLGASDYITKPFHIEEVKARVEGHLSRLFHQRELEHNVEKLSRSLEKQIHEVDTIYNLFYGTIVNIALAKSKETGQHLVRTKYYLGHLLKKYLEIYGIPASICETDQQEVVEPMMQAATMHDIGKVGIPDLILLKPGKLTPKEFEIMKRHTIIGYEMLNSKDISLNNTVLTYAKQITRHHHERWDGSGYPDGLKAEEIPFAARVMSIADVYDAPISKRTYKKPFPHREAIKIIYQGSGNAFDPVLVDIFLNEHKTLHQISKDYRDRT